MTQNSTTERYCILLAGPESPWRADVVAWLDADPRFVAERPADLREALARLDSGGVDVILLDLHGGGWGGSDAFGPLHRRAPEVPIIVLTGEEEAERFASAFWRGAHDYLVGERLGPELLAKSILYAIERAAALRAVRESELRFRRLSEATGEGIVIHENGIVIDANLAALRMVGATREQAIGEDAFAYVAPEERQRVRRHVEERETRPLETVARRSDGTLFPVEIEGKNVTVLGREARVIAFRDLSERKQAAEQLREKEARLRKAQRLARLGFLDWNLKTNELTWSEEVYRIFGVEPGTPVTFDLAVSMVHPDDREIVQEKLSAAARGEVPYEVDHRMVRADGAIIWVHASADLERDERGEPAFLYGNILEITERKLAEQRIARQARAQAAAAALGRRALAGAGLEELMQEAVEAVAEVLEVEYAKVLELLPEGDALLLRAGVGWRDGLVGRAVVDAGSVSQAGYTLTRDEAVHVEDLASETRFSGPDLLLEHGVVSGMSVKIRGKQRPFGVLGAHTAARRAFTADDAHFLEAIANVLADAIERQRAEEELRRLNLALEQRQRHTEALLTAIPDMMFRVNAAGTFLEYFPGAGIPTYVPPEEFLGRNLRDVMPPELAERALRDIRRVLERGGPATQEYVLEFDGQPRHYEYRIVVCADDEVLAIVRDITEVKQAEAEIRALNLTLERRVAERTAALEAANRELESFSYSVSHDLKAPLRAIDGFSKVLVDRCGETLDEEGLRCVDVIRENTTRMGRLIDDLLEFSRVGRQELQVAEIDTRALVEEVFEELRPADGADSERVCKIVLGPLDPVRADRRLLRQVFANLIANAIKFSEPRPQTVVEVASRAGPEEVVFHVKDNGVGFDMEYAGKLFGVFERLHYEDEFPGTGVGLAIVRRAVERHGGRVWAESREGEGATFSFSIPVPA